MFVLPFVFVPFLVRRLVRMAGRGGEEIDLDSVRNEPWRLCCVTTAISKRRKLEEGRRRGVRLPLLLPHAQHGHGVLNDVNSRSLCNYKWRKAERRNSRFKNADQIIIL